MSAPGTLPPPRATLPVAIPEGSPAAPRQVTLKEILDEASDELFSLDRGLPGTFLSLCWRPAHVVRAYLFARDARRYVRPLRYLLLSIALSVAASWLVLDKWGFRDRLGASEQALAQTSFLLEYAAVLTLLVLPLIATALRLAFHGLQVRYVDALVLLGYTQAQINLLSLLGLGWLAVSGSNDAQVPLALVGTAYLVWSWSGFATGPAWRRWLSSLLALVLGQVINAAVVWGVIRLGGLES
jgi:hypothetical protein